MPAVWLWHSGPVGKEGMRVRNILFALALIAVLVAVGLYLSQLPLGAPAGSPAAGTSPTASDSPSAAWYELRFTKPLIPDSDKSKHKGGPDEALVELMDRARKTLDVADYDFDLANVASAMVKAKQRGVAVRMVTDTDTLQNTKDQFVRAAFDQLRKAAIPIVDDRRGAIMHDKFTVVDDEWVETGSWNYTDGDSYRLNNNMIVIHSSELAANYAAEFERMFVKHQFGPQKSAGAHNTRLTIDGVAVENYFSPKDNPADHVIDVVRQAKESVYFLAFSFTHDGIGDAMVAQAKAGRKVGGVFETTGSNTPFSEYGKMKKEGLDVWADGSPYSMHHKVIIVDEQVVVFGSFNFSAGADDSNDENLLIVHDAGLAKQFKAEYDRVLALAKNPPR